MDLSLHPAPAPLNRLRLSVLLRVLGFTAILILTAFGLNHYLMWPDMYPAYVLAALVPALWLALTGLDRHGHESWGPANSITLLRGGMMALIAGTIPFADALTTGQAWVLAVIAITALILDGADGGLARRRGMSSPYGARFDMELDGVAILYLALLLWRSGEVGAWVLLLGLLRPGFVMAGRHWPCLTAPLPPSQRRRVICVVQVAVLAGLVTPVVEPPLSGFAAGAALALLLFSFAVDTVWLIRHGHAAGAVTNG